MLIFNFQQIIKVFGFNKTISTSSKIDIKQKSTFFLESAFYLNNSKLNYPAKVLNNKNNKPDKIIVTGNVKIHAIAIFLMVPPCRFFMPFVATILPATPDERT